MQDLPNYRHSTYIREMCEALDLDEPFRFLYPDRKKFTYRPFGRVRRNRSRLDFFVMSKGLLSLKFDCFIPEATLGTFFDHKHVNLKFETRNGAGKRVKKLQISNFILHDPDVDIVAWVSVFETYLNYLHVEPELAPDLNRTLLMCGEVRNLLKQSGPDEGYYVNNLTAEKLELRKDNFKKIRRIMTDYPVDLLYNFNITIDDDLFFEILFNNFRNDIFISELYFKI
jgi:hypothetical protein